MQNVITEPDYANKVDLKPYTSASNYFEITKPGFLHVNSGMLKANTPLTIYDNSGIADMYVSQLSNAIYFATSLLNQSSTCTIPVSIGMQLYVTGGDSGYVWFVPYK